VEEATHDKIRDLIQPDSLDALTRFFSFFRNLLNPKIHFSLILINAIYFKGNWADKFNAERTEKKTFYASPGQEKQAN
jgi:serine protease inhibitor